MSQLVQTEIVKADEIILPEIEVVIDGKIEKSNLTEFCTALKSKIKGLNRKLATDNDFSVAKDQVKFLKDAENALKKGKDQMLKDAEELYKHLSQFDDVGGECLEARLGLERQIKIRNEELKKEIINAALEKIEAKKKYTFVKDIEAAVKGKKSFVAMEISAAEKVEQINSKIFESRQLLDDFIEERGKVLIPDIDNLELLEHDNLQTELARRVERAEAEAERKRLEAEKAELLKKQAEVEKLEPAPTSAPPPQNTEKELQVETETNVAVSAKGELLAFCEQVKLAFAPLKAVRAGLKNQRSAQAAKNFSQAVNAAYFELEKEAQK